MIDIEEAIKINILCVFYATMHTFTPYMSMKDNFGAEFLICDQLRADAQTLSGSSPAKNKKEPLLRLFFIWCERRDLNPLKINSYFLIKTQKR